MEPDLENPFTPGTAVMPPKFAGRHSLLQDIMALARPLFLSTQSAKRAPNRDVIICGPEGFGKTVLLRTIEIELRRKFAARDTARNTRQARKEDEAKDCTILHWTFQTFRTRQSAIEAVLPKGLWQSFIDAKKRIVVFGVRLAFDDSTSHTLHSALAARVHSGPLVILLDDAQGIKPEVAEELLKAGQLLRSQGAPLLLILAGTDALINTLNEVDSTLLRRSDFFSIGALDKSSARQALAAPLKDIGAKPTEIDTLLRDAGGHPYRLQEMGRLVVQELNKRKSKTVTASVAQVVRRRFKNLDDLRDRSIVAALVDDAPARGKHKDRLEELESEKKRLEALRKELDLEKKRLEGQWAELDTDRRRAEEWRKVLDAEENRFEERGEELEERRKKLDGEKKHLEEERVELDVERKRLTDLRGELDSDRRRLEGRREKLDSDKKDLEKGREALDAERKRLGERGEELDADKKRLEGGREELDGERKRLEKGREALDAERRRLGERGEELDADKKRLEGRREALDAQKKGLEEGREEFEADKKRLERQREEFDSDKKHLEARRREMEAENQHLRERCKKMESESRGISAFYLQIKRQRPTRWRWLFGDHEPPASSAE